MADTVLGYVTLAEATSYVQDNYLSSDTLRLSWEELSDADKSVLLRKSFADIELLPFTGHKTSCSQENAFPRCPDQTVPGRVKAAQVENALSYLDEEAVEDSSFYDGLRQKGITSYSIGDLSESFGKGAGSQALVSSTALKLLQRWLSGGYRI